MPFCIYFFQILVVEYSHISVTILETNLDYVVPLSNHMKEHRVCTRHKAALNLRKLNITVYTVIIIMFCRLPK